MPPRKRNLRDLTEPIGSVPIRMIPSVAEIAESAESARVSENTEVAETTIPMKRLRGGKPKGAQAFTVFDQQRLLEICEEVLPFGADLWETVSVKYRDKSSHAGRKGRDAQWLKKQFTDMMKRAKPTGDPNQPEEVLWAKEISASIEEKINMGTLNDDSEDDQDELEETEAVENVQLEKPVLETVKVPSTPLPVHGISVQRIRTTKPSIASQSKQALDQIISSLNTSGSEIASMTQHLERSSMIQTMQNQLNRSELRIEKLEDKIERLQENNSALKDENRELKMRLMFLDKIGSTVPSFSDAGELDSVQTGDFSSRLNQL